MTNDCVFDCKYCPNRKSADVERTVITPEEICDLVTGFYRRNYIEGLFLSSAVYKNPDYTMELLYETLYLLRTKYKFNGYIHLKGIPYADKLLTDKAAALADRMSYNVELPSEKSLKLLAPQKTKESVFLPMGQLAEKKRELVLERTLQTGKTPKAGTGRFLPAGQTTQMIVGASPERDGTIIRLTQAMYRKYDLKRVYYSSYIPVVQDPLLPDKSVGLLREHRLYQADWLLRFYGFTAEEIAGENEDLPMEYDPKCAWALKNMHLFPVEINKAPVETLLRVPGIGAKSAYKITVARKYTRLTFDDLKKMRVVLKRAKHFITCSGKFYGSDKPETVRLQLTAIERMQNATQLSLFSSADLSPDLLQPFNDLYPLKESKNKDDERFLLYSKKEIASSVLSGEL